MRSIRRYRCHSLSVHLSFSRSSIQHGRSLCFRYLNYCSCRMLRSEYHFSYFEKPFVQCASLLGENGYPWHLCTCPWGGTSITFYALYCKPAMQRVYWTVNAISAGAAAITLFDTGGGGNKMRTLRGGVFSLLAISAMLPALHSVGLTGWTRAYNEIGVHWYLAEALSLLLGVGLFLVDFRRDSVQEASTYGATRISCFILALFWARPPCRWTCGRVSISSSKYELLMETLSCL